LFPVSQGITELCDETVDYSAVSQTCLAPFSTQFTDWLGLRRHRSTTVYTAQRSDAHVFNVVVFRVSLLIYFFSFDVRCTIFLVASTKAYSNNCNK